MADTVPDNPTTRHHPQADGDTRGVLQGARPHCRLHTATHPHGGPPGHGSAHATDSCCQDTYGTHKYLQHAATLLSTDQAHLLKLLFYQP